MASEFNPLKPFATQDCYEDFLAVFRNHKFKLYDDLVFNVVYKDDLEFDLHTEDKHFTEQDLKSISNKFAGLNMKWKTEITYCLFPSKKFPVSVLINIRSPEAEFSGDF